MNHTREQLEALVAELPNMPLEAILIIAELDSQHAHYRERQESALRLLGGPHSATHVGIANEYNQQARALEGLRKSIVSAYLAREAMKEYSG